MADAKCIGDSLDILMQKITNPLNESYDSSLVYTFCEKMRTEQDGYVTATRLLAYRVQSPQEKEALLALDLLETCARSGGAGFQAELGKFRFLNELIKLLSPRYLASRTPHRVKQRVADLLFTWSRELKHEPKIAEAFELLEKQGLLTQYNITPRLSTATQRDSAQLTNASGGAAAPSDNSPLQQVAGGGPPGPPPSERPKNPIFEDAQKAALLKRLLQSKDPEDIQAANRLIKNMVKQDEERIERVSRRVTELETVRTNLSLLHDMLNNFSPDTTSRDEMELMTELRGLCEQYRLKLDKLAAETDDKDPALVELVGVSEDIGAALSLYDQLFTDAAARPLQLLSLESPTKPQAPPTQRSSTNQMLEQQLAQLGLADLEPVSAPGESDLMSSHMTLSNLPTSGPPLAATSSTRGHPASGGGAADLMMLGGSPGGQLPLISGIVQSSQPSQAPASAAARSSALDDLDELVKLSMSATANRPEITRPAAAPTLSTSLPPPSLPPPTNPFDDLQGLSLPPPVTTPSSSSLTNGSEPSLLDLGSPPAVAAGRADWPAGDDVSLLSTNGGSGGMSPARSAPSVDRQLSLVDVTVALHDIKPGTQPPVTVFTDAGGLTVNLHVAQNRPRDDVTVYVISALNGSGRPVSQYTLQVAVDKGTRVKLQPPSSTDLPAGSPFLPPPAITQILLLANPSQIPVTFRFMLSLTVDGETVTEMADLPDPSRTAS